MVCVFIKADKLNYCIIALLKKLYTYKMLSTNTIQWLYEYDLNLINMKFSSWVHQRVKIHFNHFSGLPAISIVYRSRDWHYFLVEFIWENLLHNKSLMKYCTLTVFKKGRVQDKLIKKLAVSVCKCVRVWVRECEHVVLRNAHD